MSPWYCPYIMKRISIFVYQLYVNAISKSYIRNLILLRYFFLHPPDIAVIYKRVTAKSDTWYLHDIAFISWKGDLLTYIQPMSMQYPNPISETWYCSDISFYIAQILLWYTNGAITISDAWYLRDIALISRKGYLLTYINPMSMQYPNPISETWYCGDIHVPAGMLIHHIF